MSDNEMDDIVRKAASEYHPPYNDKAWDKMEQLLDTHLPVKKDRSYRGLYLLLLLLLLGTATYFGVTYLAGKSKPNHSIVQNTPNQQTNNSIQSNDNKTPGNSANNSKSGSITSINSSQPSDLSGLISNTSNNSVTSNNTVNSTSATISNKNSARKPLKQRTNAKTNIYVADKYIDVVIEPSNKEVTSDNKRVIKTEPTDDKKVNDVAVSKLKEEPKPFKKDSINTKDTSGKKATASSNKKRHGFGDRFGIAVSLGPDISFVRPKDMGQMSPNYGAGLSYKLSNHFTILSGFYVTNKIYNADSADYSPPKEFWNYYKTLDEVYAYCKVFEIPVLLTYNFRAVKKHNWFVTTGLSSFLMNTETYTYYYTSTSGNYTNKTYTLTNQNKHYFAVLTLSGGYRYNINKRFSLEAAPYLKLPLAGVGYGKVKLNSAGALFTVTLRPFSK